MKRTSGPWGAPPISWQVKTPLSAQFSANSSFKPSRRGSEETTNRAHSLWQPTCQGLLRTACTACDTDPAQPPPCGLLPAMLPDRYESFGFSKPLVVGSLGFWHPKNDEIRSIIGINHNLWTKLRRAASTIAIEHSMETIRDHVSKSCHLSNPQWI